MSVTMPATASREGSDERAKQVSVDVRMCTDTRIRRPGR
jgi:hypothetical protein